MTIFGHFFIFWSMTSSPDDVIILRKIIKVAENNFTREKRDISCEKRPKQVR